MLICPVCNATKWSSARFCMDCGAELPPTPVTPAPVTPCPVVPGPVATNTLSPPRRGVWQCLFPVVLLVALVILINVVEAFSVRGKGAVSLASEEVLQAVAFAALVAAFLLLYERQLVRELMTCPAIKLSTVGVTVGALAVMVLFMSGYMACARHLGFHVDNPMRRFVEAGWPLGATLLLLSVAPAVTEEIAFRGIVLSRLDGVFGRNEALVVQAALFGIVHMLPMIFVSHFMLGLALGFVRRRTGSLYPCMFMHAAYNAWAVLF